MSEIRNQLKSQSLGAVLPASLLQVGGVIFPDDAAVTDMLDLQQIVQAFRAVHSPSYGQPIAGTNTVIQGGGQGNMLEVTNGNEVVRIDAIHINNTGVAPLTAYIRIGDCPLNSSMDSFNNATMQPNGNAVIIGPFFMDSTDALNAAVTDGTANDLQWSVKYSLVSQ